MGPPQRLGTYTGRSLAYPDRFTPRALDCAVAVDEGRRFCAQVHASGFRPARRGLAAQSLLLARPASHGAYQGIARADGMVIFSETPSGARGPYCYENFRSAK